MEEINRAVKEIISFLNLDDIAQLIREEVAGSYSGGMEHIGIKLDMNFVPYPERIRFFEKYSFDNVKGMSEEIAERLRKELTAGLMNNESGNSLKKRVSKTMDVCNQRASMIARTETARAENFGMLDGARQSGLKVKKWLLITHDDRTSDISKKMGVKYGSTDKAIPLENNFKVVHDGKIYEGLAPPFHVNDRDQLMIVQVD